MGRSVKTFTIIFLSFMSVFVFYQFLIGNPFFDEVPPVLVYIGALILAVLSIIAIVKEKRRRGSA